MTFAAGGIVWSRDVDLKPFLVVRVDHDVVHFLDLFEGRVFDINMGYLRSLMDSYNMNDLYYETPCPRIA